MAICGNRAKQAAHRDRLRKNAADPPASGVGLKSVAKIQGKSKTSQIQPNLAKSSKARQGKAWISLSESSVIKDLR